MMGVALMRGWVPIFREVEVSHLVEIETLHSLHHGSVGYQHACTRVGLTEKAYSCRCNREHKQEQEGSQLNLQMND
jgi:hypothetical protein